MKLTPDFLKRLRGLCGKAHPNQGEFPNMDSMTAFMKACDPLTVSALVDAVLEMKGALEDIRTGKNYGGCGTHPCMNCLDGTIESVLDGIFQASGGGEKQNATTQKV